MSKKSLLMGLSTVLIMVTVSVFPVVIQAQQETGEQVLPGGANFIFINYIGQDLSLDLDDVNYIVPGTAISPEGGQLTLRLAPGEHKFAASVPGVPLGTAEEFTLEPGGVVAKAARLDQTPPTVENGILIEKPRDFVDVFDFDPFAPLIEETAVVDTWQPASAPPGIGSLVWTNYSGQDELTVDLAGQLYKVAPQANGIPGRLQIEVDPGFYRYTASVPNGSLNGEVTVVPGQVIGLSITAEQEEQEYDVGDFFDFIPNVNLKLFQEDLTSRTGATQPDAAPPALPITGEEVNLDTVTTVARPDGLLIKNFAGDTLIFTINNEAYPIPVDTESVLPLPPGQYNYTASLPFVATTGTVDLSAGQTIELSIVINIAGDVLSIYQN